MRFTRPSVWLGRRVNAQEEGSADGPRSKEEAKGGSLLVPLTSEKLASSTLHNALYRVGDLCDTRSFIEHLVCASLLCQDFRVGV
jgi:hypothetical protein